MNYVKSVSLQPNKEIFSVEHLTIDKFATSLGLDSTPNSRALQKLITRAEKRKPKSEGFSSKKRTIDDDVKSLFEASAVTGLRHEMVHAICLLAEKSDGCKMSATSACKVLFRRVHSIGILR